MKFDGGLALLAWLNDDERQKKQRVAEWLAGMNDHDLAQVASANSPAEKLASLQYPLADNLREFTRTELMLVQNELLRLEKAGTRLVPLTSPEYPSALRTLRDPPLVLFVRGTLGPEESRVAVTGTRRLSARGHFMAREIGRALAESGRVVVSGLAHGTDTEAHCGALEGLGGTVAVLPGSVVDIIPEDNAPLAGDIVTRGGGLVAESTNLRPVHKGRFVQRNRIISALSNTLVAVETGPSGGSVHQVSFAVAQGRRVFALEPSPGAAEAIAGHRALVKMGAEPFKDTKDLLTRLDQAPGRHRVSSARSLRDYAGT